MLSFYMSLLLPFFFPGFDVLISNHHFQMGPKFMKENGLKHVTFSTADGALEAAPAVVLSFVSLQ